MEIPLISIIVAFILLAVALWALRTLAPQLGLPPIVVTVVTVLLVVVFCLWLLSAFGLMPSGTVDLD
jgi:hypothetical protein